ncbi:hypothetical protein AB6O49_27820 [Streptomyces sp. SBR177]
MAAGRGEQRVLGGVRAGLDDQADPAGAGELGEQFGDPQRLGGRVQVRQQQHGAGGAAGLAGGQGAHQVAGRGGDDAEVVGDGPGGPEGGAAGQRDERAGAAVPSGGPGAVRGEPVEQPGAAGDEAEAGRVGIGEPAEQGRGPGRSARTDGMDTSRSACCERSNGCWCRP